LFAPPSDSDTRIVHPAIRVEPGTDVGHPREAANEQPRADEDGERERHFGSDDQMADAPAGRAA
jgi:hypothetical protein